ncbi:MAG: ATP synthase F1 subunit epsilon [Acidobacteriota bacterium]|nr:ATP synthase F1 subunit epsilon [Acidobacteriota bacterium]
MATLRVEIVTPESALWAGDARALMARSSDGEFTVLAQHTATVGDVVPGVVRVETDEGELSFAVHGGYFQVAGEGEGVTRATVLAGVAERTADIDLARAQRAKERAEEALAAEARGEVEDHAAHLWAPGALARAELRLRAAGGAQRADT